MINIEGFHFDSILLDEKSYENTLIDDVSCNTLIGAKPLHIMFYKLGRFIRDNNWTKSIVLFGLDAIFDRLRYFIGSKKRHYIYFSHNYAKIKIDSDDNLPLEKTLISHNIIIFIKSVFDKNKNHYYYYDIFFEKCFNQLAKK